MRAIDADALDTKAFGSEHPYFFDGDDVARWYKECIKTAPTIEPTANWTPCSVGLPEKGIYVIGYLRTKEIKNDPMLIVCKYDESEDDDCFFDRDGWREDVLAWQPLPEPYRGGE